MKVAFVGMLVLFAGCVTTKTIEGLLDDVSSHDHQAMNSVYYIGTENDYDYFRHETLFWGRTVRVRPQVVPERARMPYVGGNEEKWLLVKSNHGIALELEYFIRNGKPVGDEGVVPKVVNDPECL